MGLTVETIQQSSAALLKSSCMDGTTEDSRMVSTMNPLIFGTYIFTLVSLIVFLVMIRDTVGWLT